MTEQRKQIIAQQLDFYAQGLAGCKFAEHAAKKPNEHNWGHVVIEHPSAKKLDEEVERAINDPKINQLSIVLPNIKTQFDLENLIKFLTRDSKIFFFEPSEEFAGHTLVKMRAHISGKRAWVSGFGPFPFLPKTRQTPYTELVFRVKDKPDYPPSIQHHPHLTSCMWLIWRCQI